MLQVYGDGCRTAFQPDVSTLQTTYIHPNARQRHATSWCLNVNRDIASVLRPSVPIFTGHDNQGFPFHVKYRLLPILTSSAN